MQIYSITHKGLVRSTNQDTLLISDNLYGVADGMGGHLGGETASKLAGRVIENMLANKSPSETILRIGMEAANRRVFERQKFDFALRGMGTTLTVLWEADDHVLVAHVGDSRAYLLRNNKLQCITQDHSVVGEMLRSNTLSPQEAKAHPYRNVITRAIGTTPVVEVDLFREKKETGDIWLLCSDGLYNKVENLEIEDIILTANQEEAAQKLLELALDRGGEDNVSILLAYVTEVSEA